MTFPPHWQAAVRSGWRTLSEFPWRQMAALLLRRFRDARLGVSASSLTFTTVLALVPLFTVGLALFSAFPVFGKFQDTIQRWLIDSLVPESISRQVLGYLTQFSRKASRLGAVGLVAVLLSAVALMVTIERTLGQIWRTQQQRPLPQRLILYWSAITLGPLLLGASLAITSYVMSASRGVVGAMGGMPLNLRWWLDTFEFVLLVLCVSGLYFYVPYTRVRWRHALTAGLLSALGLELGKELLTTYLHEMPTYSAIYGAFAAVPILLVWIYMAWLIVLLGAVVASSLPELGRQPLRRPRGAGWHFDLALQVLGLMWQARLQGQGGLSTQALASALQVHADDLAPVLRTLGALDWLGPLQEEGQDGPRWVLLVEPQQTPLTPLCQRLLLRPRASNRAFWQASDLSSLRLADALDAQHPPPLVH